MEDPPEQPEDSPDQTEETIVGDGAIAREEMFLDDLYAAADNVLNGVPDADIKIDSLRSFYSNGLAFCFEGKAVAANLQDKASWSSLRAELKKALRTDHVAILSELSLLPDVQDTDCLLYTSPSPRD
eukprot:1699230-Alexandrium_andersonii.AAC.1